MLLFVVKCIPMHACMYNTILLLDKILKKKHDYTHIYNIFYLYILKYMWMYPTCVLETIH